MNTKKLVFEVLILTNSELENFYNFRNYLKPRSWGLEDLDVAALHQGRSMGCEGDARVADTQSAPSCQKACNTFKTKCLGRSKSFPEFNWVTLASIANCHQVTKPLVPLRSAAG